MRRDAKSRRRLLVNLRVGLAARYVVARDNEVKTLADSVFFENLGDDATRARRADGS